MSESGTRRLFVALALPSGLKDELVALQPSPGAGLRPIHRDALHLTLCFIGNASVEAVHRALQGVCAEPFSLILQGVARHFRGGRGLLWAEVLPCDPLNQLQAHLVSTLKTARLPVDSKRFRPHVTLARYRGAGSRRKIEAFLDQGASFSCGPVAFSRFALFSSETRPEGAVYRVEHRYPLKPG
ncbi:MAG: RNA 2',3'-cyclic phosphodiesterase [Sedimenticola sp.]|nr:RNA 2',3'-cyclic phosphodiesterase [Sedimenticola sp.]